MGAQVGFLVKTFARGKMIRSHPPGCDLGGPGCETSRESCKKESHPPFVKTYATLGYL